MAFALIRQGETSSALPEIEFVANERQARFGALNASCLVARGTLANARGLAGDISGAVGGFRSLVNEFTIAFGPLNELTLRTRYYYTQWLVRENPSVARRSGEHLRRDIADSLGSDHVLYGLTSELR